MTHLDQEGKERIKRKDLFAYLAVRGGERERERKIFGFLQPQANSDQLTTKKNMSGFCFLVMIKNL